MNYSSKSTVITLIDKTARLSGQRIGGSQFGYLQEGIALLNDDSGALEVFRQAWIIAKLKGAPSELFDPMPLNLPFVVFSEEFGWGIINKQLPNGQWQGVKTDDESFILDNLENIVSISIPHSSTNSKTAQSSLEIVTEALMSQKRIFIDAVLATALITLLALATSLYSMQVFDRVIPNNGFDTLWVLSIGVILSICLEMILKQTRSHLVDRTSNDIDRQLSGWFFNRMLGIRMEARPASVGTLASQVKGFEMVRGVLASTSLFVIADVPFAIFFIVVIGLVGGWVVLVPVITLPIALFAGLAFQRSIQRHTRENLSASNKKAGLLVEAVDAAESLKSFSAEFSIESRWNRLVDETSKAEQSIRDHSSLSQNSTVWFQQISYVSIIALGAYFVTENEMTMGALLACSILGNRAMTPVVQIPGVMLQWALAKAAIEGLDQIIMLPNEADEIDQTLAPEYLESNYRFERISFMYGASDRKALEIEHLEIKAGESVGLIGPIGSGKSTLLKLASGLYRPGEGKVFVGDMDIALVSPMIIRELIGYLPQDIRLFSGTLRDNLIFGLPDPGDEAILAAAKRTGLIEVIVGQPQGLSLELTEGGRGVSGGQRQLIGLTRMLLAKQKIWLLDEPTGSLDSVSEIRIVNLLKELISDGVTVILSTHKTALLPLVSRLIVLQGGRMVLDGSRDDVLQKLSAKSRAQQIGK